MRLSLVLPNVEKEKPTPPARCPYDDCQSTNLRLHQEVVKPLRDTRYQQVTAYRYQCLTCKRTFRVYPSGVNSAPTSQRVKDLGVVLYMLGLSYRSVSHALESMGVYLCASCVYSAVQTTTRQRPEFTRQSLLEGIKTANSGTSTASVKYHGKWFPISLTMGAEDGAPEATLSFDELSEEDALEMASRIAPFVQARLEEIQQMAEPALDEQPRDETAQDAPAQASELPPADIRVATAPATVEP